MCKEVVCPSCSAVIPCGGPAKSDGSAETGPAHFGPGAETRPFRHPDSMGAFESAGRSKCPFCGVDLSIWWPSYFRHLLIAMALPTIACPVILPLLLAAGLDGALLGSVCGAGWILGTMVMLARLRRGTWVLAALESGTPDPGTGFALRLGTAVLGACVYMFVFASCYFSFSRTGGTTAWYLIMKSRSRGAAEALMLVGADPNRVLTQGMTPLHMALMVFPDPLLIDSMLSGGADPNLSDGYGQTGLFYCLDKGSERVLKLLLDKGADPNRPDRVTGLAPLHRAAAIEDNLQVLALLVSAGANTNALDNRGQTPAAIARGRGCALNAEWLEGIGAD